MNLNSNWRSTDEIRPYLLASFVWLVMVAVFFWPVIFQGKVIAPLDILESLLRPWATTEKVEVHNAFTYDAVSQYLPYDYSVYQSLQADGYMGWNPYTHSGSSIVENTMICPGDWHHHLYRFLPFWTAWNTGIIVQFALAGLGLLLLLRDQKIPPAYALVGVIAFGFYSQFTLWIYHGWVLGAMCWSPWILWALFRARKAGRIVDLPSIAFIALAFRGGHLQACIFVVILVILVALAEWWRSEERWNLRHIWKILLPYAVCGVLGSLLALDVWVETVPALLHGKRDMPSRSWVDTLIALPTLITSVFPALLGTPQGLDITKVFRIDLFSIKFMGAVPLLLASLACFRRRSPAAAKLLFTAGIVLPFTPVDQWLYSRFSVIFALGGAWLAAWYLHTISTEPKSKVWRRALILFSIIVGAWLLGSVALTAKHAWIQDKLHEVVLANIPDSKPFRADWMLSRADFFLTNSLVWTPYNLATLAFIASGILACSFIHDKNRNAPAFALLASLFAFAELFLFSSTWVTFSSKPSNGGLYHEPGWATQLRREVGNGTILCFSRSDFDYMQLNTPSVYGIRFAEGYETVTPRRIDPHAGGQFDARRCADSGISHILAAPEKDPVSIPGWEKAIDSKSYVLYRNPLFNGICHAELATGTQQPIDPVFQSPNRREIRVPQGTLAVNLLESFNPGWKFTTDGETWQQVRSNNLHSIRVDLGAPVSEPTRIMLQYHPVHQSYYRIIIALTLAGLLGFGLWQAWIGKKLAGRDTAPSA